MKKKNFSLAVLGLMSVLLAVAATSPELREKIRGRFQSSERKILATAHADLTDKGEMMTVLKVMSAGELTLEVYLHENTPNLHLQKITLPQTKDGFFDFQGKVTNLALYDIDGDGTLEIIAPTFDDNLIPRLNVYKYNPATQNFEPFKDSSD